MPGAFVWEVPGKPVVVHLLLDVVDRMSADIMRGFGAVPKRGAEVGGVLIGTIEPGDVTIVRVTEYESVPCHYMRGPSYLLTDSERVVFDEVCERWTPVDAPAGSRVAFAVGYYRSHTRDGLALAPEDTELLDRHFGSPNGLALLVKPYASKVSVAGFFFREDGAFPEATPQEFPFRRWEMTGEEPPQRQSLFERKNNTNGETWREPLREALLEPAREEPLPSSFTTIAETNEPAADLSSDEVPGAPGTRSKLRFRSVIWIPLSFAFLVLGVVLGYQAALTRGPGAVARNVSDFSLSLSVSRTGDNLTVRWNREAPAIRAAQKGLLEIVDGGYFKPVELDQAHLQGGSIIYQDSSDLVRFRLIVYLDSQLNVTETAEFRK